MSNIPYPHTLSKKEIRRALRCTSQRAWKSKFFTDRVLDEVLKITREDWNHVIVLDAHQTKAVIQFFELKPESFTV